MQNLRDVVKILQLKGHNVKFRNRSDGGILITSLDGVAYSGAVGNTIARNIVGFELSEKRKRQLVSIKPPKLPAIPDDLKREIRKAQRLWKNNKPKVKGKITTKKVRFVMGKEGVKSTIKKLKKAERYAQGIAYEENIDFLITRLERLKEMYPEIEEVISTINRAKLHFKEEWINEIYNLIYEIEKKTLNIKDGIRRIKAIIT